MKSTLKKIDAIMANEDRFKKNTSNKYNLDNKTILQKQNKDILALSEKLKSKNNKVKYLNMSQVKNNNNSFNKLVNDSNLRNLSDDDFDDEDDEINNKKFKIKERSFKRNIKLCFYYIKVKVNYLINSLGFIAIMMIITLYVLFLNDIKYAFLSPSLDSIFKIIDIFSLICFLVELILAIVFQDNYNLSFYFWLDLVSTISLVIEIDGVMDFILNLFLTETEENNYSSLNENQNITTNQQNNSTNIKNTNSNSKTTEKLSKAAKTWKVTRIVRVIRIIRLIKIVKIYKSAMLAKKKYEEQREKMLQDAAKKDEEMNQEKEKINTKFMFKIKKFNDNFILNKKRKAFRDKGKKNLINNNKNMFQGKKNYQQAREERKIEIIKLRENNLLEEFENQRDDNDYNNKINELENDINDEYNVYNNPNAINSNNKINTENDDNQESITKESNISKIISKSITKKVIILILSMVIGMPLFDISVYYDINDNFSHNIIAEYLSGFIKYKNGELNYKNNSNSEEYRNDKFEFLRLIHKKLFLENVDEYYPIVNITYNDILYYKNASLNNTLLRKNDIGSSYSSDEKVLVNYLLKDENSVVGVLEVIKTILIGFLIVYAAVSLENDAKNLVLGPMEIILEIVETVTTDPIKAKNPDNFKIGLKNLVNNINNEDVDEVENSNNATDKKKKSKTSKRERDLERYEVIKVKESIIKISSLLVIGMGDSGCDIIKNNLIKFKNKDQVIDLYVKGKKVKGIFSICCIDNLDNIIKALQEKSTLYVNKISDYIHSSTDKFGGTSNKNVFDEIFLSWNFRTLREFKQGKLYNKDIKQMADLSLCAVFDSISNVKSRKMINNWKFDDNINKHISNFTPNVSFALHIGNAIEGMIGSQFKIENCYVSKNMVVLEKIKQLLPVYSVDILMSDAFYSQLSEDMKEICRLIDVVKFKESITYTKLYTVDINTNLPTNEEEDLNDLLPSKDKLLKHLTKKERFRKFLNSTTGGKNNKISSFAFSKKGFKDLLSTNKSADFYRYFDKAINDYIVGDWKSAKLNLEQCEIYDKYDKPMQFLYNYIKKFKFKAPKRNENKWTGKRDIN